MNGLLIIDKPEGLTSHDVVARVRRTLRTKRVGHTGTLDPLATGVMVILVGKATRLAKFLEKDTKEYFATVQFGFETDTGDRTGRWTEDLPTAGDDLSVVLSGTNWVETLAPFRGNIEQTPPMYSAKKVDGKKLYELARMGLEVARKPAAITIHELEVIETAGAGQVFLRVVCSAGTYIRTLAQDIGRRIGTGAHLVELRRTASGKFTIADSMTLDLFENLDDPAAALRPIREATGNLPVFEISDERVGKTRNGMSTRDLSGRFADRENIQMVDAAGELIAVGFYDDAAKAIQPKIVLV
jgi:tRNA pseudouridine55 synthase